MPNNPKIKTIYSNHILQAPDGTPISRIGSDRSEWYVERGLAKVVRQFPFRLTSRFPFIAKKECPYTIRLTFEPAGRGHEGDSYYMANKENRCVVCGREDNINKHHVVPRLYRKQMPERYKDRTSHDVVILCVDCHTRYETEANKRKRQIAKDLGYEYAVRKLEDLSPEKVRESKARKAAAALMLHRDTIPQERISALEGTIREHLQSDLIELEDIEALYYDISFKLPNYMGDEMAKFVLARVKLQEFGLGWRKHFIDVMKPKYLPAGWDVERPLARAS
jgi:exonuclease 3'-5' domain-containing protein 2